MSFDQRTGCPKSREFCAEEDAASEPLSSASCHAAIASSSEGFAVLDHQGRILELNVAFARQCGAPSAELVGRPFWELERFITASRMRALLERVVAEGPQVRDGRLGQRGQSVHVECALSHHAGRWYVFTRPTRRHATERLLIARELVARVALEGTADDVVQATVDAAETLTGSCIGFMHFVEPDQRGLALHSWSTNTLRNMCTAEGKGAHYPIEDAGVWTDCVKTRRPVIHNDYASLPHKKGLPPGHAPIVRELVIPVLRADVVTAILGVGNKPTLYTEQDVDTVATLASLCIDLVARKRTEEDLRASEARWRSLYESLAAERVK